MLANQALVSVRETRTVIFDASHPVTVRRARRLTVSFAVAPYVTVTPFGLTPSPWAMVRYPLASVDDPKTPPATLGRPFWIFWDTES